LDIENKKQKEERGKERKKEARYIHRLFLSLTQLGFKLDLLLHTLKRD